MKFLKIFVVAICMSLAFSNTVTAQVVDLGNLGELDVKDIFSKVMNVKKGFAPKFALGNLSIPKISKVAEVLGVKKNNQVNKLFSTFKTGRTVYKVASYAGGALAVYGVARKIGDSLTKASTKTAITSGLVTIGSGLIVKFLTKAASYKAVDVFNGIAVRKIKDIFSVKPASNTAGVGLYVKL
ncbi:MAG: hypothetical protein ABIR81_01920 [Ginsengibacter sp.]